MMEFTQNQSGNQLTRMEPQSEVLSATLSQLTSAEVDMQVTTAKRYPRSLQTFKHEVLSLATIDEETARSCTYSIPRGGKHITGPSIRFMEIVASSWGNIREEKRCLEPESTVIRGQATVWDMERNRLVRAEVTRRITDKNGQRYNEDMITVTGNAAASIAHRNALRACIPEGFWKKIHEQVQEVGAGGKKPLTEKRAKWMDYWKGQGVDEDRVLASLGVPSVDDIGVGELATMQGLYTAIKQGDTTLEDAFPILEETPVAGLPGTHGFGFGRKAAQPQEPQGQARVSAQLTEQLAQGVSQLPASMPPRQPAPQQAPTTSPGGGWVRDVLRMNARGAMAAIDECGDVKLLMELAKMDGRKVVLQHIAKRTGSSSDEVLAFHQAFERGQTLGQQQTPQAEPAPATAPSAATAQSLSPAPGQPMPVEQALALVRQATTLQQLMEIERYEVRREVLDAVAKRCAELDPSAKPVLAPEPQKPAEPEQLPWAKYLAQDKDNG